MHRQQLLNLLQEYQLAHPGESGMCARMIDFVRDHPQCFDRSLREGHITGSCWLVDSAGDKVLLTHHRKLNKWLQLGGHADGDPDVLRVALREGSEESGLKELEACSRSIFDIDIHLIPARGPEPSHYHYDCRFAIRSTCDDTFVVSDESHDLRWVPVTELTSITDEKSMLRMAVKWKQRQLL